MEDRSRPCHLAEALELLGQRPFLLGPPEETAEEAEEEAFRLEEDLARRPDLETLDSAQ